MIDSLQKGNNKQLTQDVYLLSQNSPLDYIVLYAKMYLSCVENDTKAACCIAGIVEFLYPYNSLLVDMAGMILEENNHDHMAYTLYKKYLFYAEESQKDEIQQVLQRLEHKMLNG